MSDPDHYLALGITRDATPDEVRDAWRLAVQAFHPDRFGDAQLRAKADLRARRVNAAWQVLGDPDLRARYDRQYGQPPRRPGPVLRELPCPSCATLSRVPDQLGQAVAVRCPACAQEFTAVVGAQLLGRPELHMRFLAGRYRLWLGAADGTRTSATVRRLPPELALAESETVSLVFGSRAASPKYIIVHGGQTDIGWKVG